MSLGKIMYFSRIFFLILLSYSVCEQISVDTKVGEIRGQIREDFTTFLGIPYGVVNEKDPFGVYDSSSYTRICWECLALLRRWQNFKQQVKKSYTHLLYLQQNNYPTHTQELPHLQIHHIHNFSYPQIQIKTEDFDTTTVEEHDQLDCIKTEEMHCEPETFVKNLNMEPKKRKKEAKKVEKTIKEKTKKKGKQKAEKVQKKIKVKKKRSPSLESIPDDPMDAMDVCSTEYDDDTKDIIPVVEKKKETREKYISFEKEPTRLNGELKPPKTTSKKEIKEILPERPHCVECGKNFSSKKTYRYHLNVLHKGQNRYPCPRCGKVYQWKSNLGRHLRSHKARDSGELYCETCDKRFASVATYRQHLRISRRHVPESEFSFMCNDCGKKFVNKTRLRDHIDWEHLKKIKFKCQLCNKPFKCHTSLYVHLKNVHRNREKKDNLCHVCGKSYQNAAKLKYHIIAMHTSETPYQCQQCTAAFGWYSSLYRHVREVHYKMKLQPKRSKKSKKTEMPSLLPQQVVITMHQPGALQ